LLTSSVFYKIVIKHLSF